MILDPETMQEVVDRTATEVADLMIAAFEALLGPNGESFGALPATGAEFVAMYLDLNSRVMTQVVTPDGQVIPIPPIEVRILDEIEVLNPKLAEQMLAKFKREAAKLLDIQEPLPFPQRAPVPSRQVFDQTVAAG